MPNNYNNKQENKDHSAPIPEITNILTVFQMTDNDSQKKSFK